MKFFVYRRVFDRALHRLAGNNMAVGQIAKTITVRRLRFAYRVDTRSGMPSDEDFPDFIDVSPHMFRERLKSLNHGRFLQEAGRGLRDAIEYDWVEPILYSNLCSYLALRRATGDRPNFGFDLYRLRGFFHGRDFTPQQFRQLFRAFRSTQIAHRWFDVARTPSSGSSIWFTEYLERRLHQIIERGLLIWEGGRLRISQKGEEAAHWFDLFVHSVSYVPRKEQCDACPVQTSCWNGEFAKSIGIQNTIPRRTLVLQQQARQSISGTTV